MKNKRTNKRTNPSPSSRTLAAGALLAVAALTTSLVVPSCAHDSYLVVVMKTTGGPLPGVSRVTVMVTDSAHGTPMATKTFTITADGGLAIDAVAGKTFSLSFTPDRSGPVDVDVTAYGAAGCMGSGVQRSVAIKKGGTASVIVALSPTTACGSSDGGTPDGNVTFVGCNPALAGSCPSPQTCYVDCTAKVGVCVQGGTRRPGETCASNGDCMPGTQCFDYGCGPTTKYCLKFCNGDADCAGSTSVAAVSTCSDPVVCPPQTSYKTCGFVCDPRGTATKGCPAGLSCFLFSSATGGEDVPACGCSAATRVGTDGASCVTATDCAPGFLCDQMVGGMFCRRICQMASPGDCPAPQGCTALQNNSTYGVCL